jgi:hypothetical protein
MSAISTIKDRVLAVGCRAWGPLGDYPPLMSYIFFTEALNEIGDSIGFTQTQKTLRGLAENSRQTIQNSRSSSESRSGFARSLFRFDGLPRLWDQPPHSPAALIHKGFYPPLGAVRS